MENYTKGKNVEQEFERDKIPIEGLPDNFLWMQVRGGSKMSNLLNHVTGILEDKTATAVVWSGVGAAISKTISCAEIIKRQFSIQHQVTKLLYQIVEEHWEPKIEGLETLVVKRQIPAIHILLTSEPLKDFNQLGSQSINGKKFWEQNENQPNKKQQLHSKRKKVFKQIQNSKN